MWSGKPYGQLLFEAWQREHATPPRDPLHKMAIEQLDREVFRAFVDGEIANVKGKFRFQPRTVPDVRVQIEVAERVEIELLRGRSRQRRGATKKADSKKREGLARRKVAEEISRDKSVVGKYHRKHRETAILCCYLKIANEVEDVRAHGRALEMAVQTVATRQRLPSAAVRSVHETALRIPELRKLVKLSTTAK